MLSQRFHVEGVRLASTLAKGAAKRRPDGPNLASILFEAGLVTEQEIEQAVLRQGETGLRIGETLVEMEAVSEEKVVWALSHQLGVPPAKIQPLNLDRELLRLFPESLLRRARAVPLVRQADGIVIAMDDPTNDELVAELERVAKVPIVLCVGKQSEIWNALDAVFGPPVARPLDRATGKGGTPWGTHDIIWEHSGTTLLAFHVTRALRKGATAVHFLPKQGRLGVHYREYGLLSLVAHEPPQVHNYLLARIAALGGPVLDGRTHARGVVRCPLAGVNEH